MSKTPIVALEIGTSKVCVLVGEAREDNNIMVTGIGQCPSAGVRKGVIIDLENVTTCVRTALHAAEQSCSLEIGQVYLAVTGGHVQSVVNPGSVPVYDPQQGITRDDIQQVMKIARTINLRHDEESLHTIPQQYTVDDHAGIINPEGMQGVKLSLDMLIVRTSRNMLSNSIKAVRSIGVDVQDIAFNGLCSALATLTPEQKECGVALMDLGAGTTSYVVYADNTIATVGVLALGGDHITNDIALGFNISLKRAEALKHRKGSAITDVNAHFQQIKVPAEVGFPSISISVSDLNTIISARADETFSMIKAELEKKNVMRHLGSGIVLTGGGAHLKGVTMAAERVFDMPCSVGKPKYFSVASSYEGPEYATPMGLIRYAIKSEEREADTVSLVEWLKGLVGGG